MSRRKTYVFVHQNMPGQFPHLVRHLVGAGHAVYFITKSVARDIPGVIKVVYTLPARPEEKKQAALNSLENAVTYGQCVARALLKLQKQGVRPDIVVGHSGWGEMIFVKDVLPDVPVLSYFELFFHAQGRDVNFDPEYGSGPDVGPRLRLRNAVNLVSLDGCDRGISPTWWQWGSYPEPYRPKITVLHEGIDTGLIRRPAKVAFRLHDGRILKQGEEIVTYVARNLEPYRGFHVFMRALAEILARRPNAHALVVGGDTASYGHKLEPGAYRKRALESLDIDLSRVHFLGRIPYETFLGLLFVSSAHIYLTYPFVLSWSMLEAMAAECLVIGSETPPVEEVITDGRNGLLVDFFDHSAIADRVIEVLTHPERYVELRRAARHTIVERYDLHGVSLPRYRALFSDLGASWSRT